MIFDPSFSVAENEILRWAQVGCGMLSILGTCFVVMSFIVFPSLRSVLYRLIVFLCLSEFFASLTFLIGLEPKTCVVQASVWQFFSMASLCWTTCIAHNIYRVLATEKKEMPREIWGHLFSWGLPTILLAVNLVYDTFGRMSPWCWVKPELPLFRLLTYFVPMCLIFLANIALYILVIRALANDGKLAPVQTRLWQYLLVFMASQAFFCVHRFHEYMYPGQANYIITLLMALATPLTGLMNAVVYGLNMQVRSHYFALLTNEEGNIEMP